MKNDCDKNFVVEDNDGVTVNRRTTTGFFAASATTNETAWVTYKMARGAAAEAHPCRFKWVTEAKAKCGAKLIVVDPRFTR